MSNIDIQYPLWFILLCLACGLGLAFLLYFRNQGLRERNSAAVFGLGVLRFLSGSLLALLLLSPVLKNRNEEIKKPIIAFAVDRSASIASETDSMALVRFNDDLAQVIEDVSEPYDVRVYSFGSEIREAEETDFSDQSSNLSSVLEYISDLYGDQNLGAVVMATDGIYNEGKDPAYADVAFAAPIYTVALGDTTPDKDLSIRQVYSNNIAYLGDESAVQIDVSAYNCKGQNASITVSRIADGKATLVERKPLRIREEDYFETFEFALPQEQVGLQRYRVVVTNLEGEKTLRNNRKDFFIDVIDARQKILVLFDHVHPDVGAIKQSLETNKNYQVETYRLGKFDKTVEEYDLVILHQLPGRRTPVNLILDKLNALKKPRIFVLGQNYNERLFNGSQDLVSIKSKGSNFNNVQALVNGGFSLFTLPEDLENKLGQFAPVEAPFADYQINPSAEVLLSQRIGNVNTDFPLLLFKEEAGIKIAVFCAEGLWRWKLYDFLQHENNYLFNELLSKTVQFISVKEDKRKFRVYQSDNLLDENEDALFEAELYNQSYELINEPDVTINISNSSNESFEFSFSRKNKGYALNAGRFPSDDYRWQAVCSHEGERYTSSGQFGVQAIEKESYATVADHNLLSRLAEGSNGRMIYPADISQLSQELIESQVIKPVYYEVIKTRSAIHLKWIFAVIATLLMLEWLFRRLIGTY